MLNKFAAIGFHTVATTLLLCITAIGWHFLPNGIWGLHTLTDGALAAWNSTSIFLWSEPFDPSPQNFLQGLGSLYIPNTPWLNPGALALSLPLEPHWQYYFSYGVYFLELFASVVVLGRALGFSILRSVLAGQLLCLTIFPPYTNYFFTLPWISLAPFNAHLMAICNLLLALLSILGKENSTRQNLAVATGIVVLLVSAFYTAAVTWVTYVPVYLLFAFAVATHQLTRKSLFWITGLATVIAATALILRIPEFYTGTTQVTSSHLLNPDPVATEFSVIVAAMRRAWTSMNWCNYPQTFFVCSTYAIKYVHAAGLAGAIILAIFYSRLARKLGLCMITYVLVLHLYAMVAQAGILGIFNRINKDFLLFSSYTFYALFSIAAAFSLLDGLQWLWHRQFVQYAWQQGCRKTSEWPIIAKKLLAQSPVLLYATGYAVLASAAPVAAILIMFGIAKEPSNQLLATQRLPPPVIHSPHKTNVTDILVREIGLPPGMPFRGSVATYFGAPEGPLREKIGFGNQPYSSTSLYHNSRFYMQAWYGNSFMMTDLWRFNIPTFEEYGQWITKPLYVFAKEIFSFTAPQDGLSSSEINIYKLNFSLMQALGIRFIITDSELSDTRLMLRATHKTSTPPVRPELSYFAKAKNAILEGDPVAVRLYEFRNPNLGSYSPTKVTLINTVKATIDRLRDPAFDPEAEVILQTAEGLSSFVRTTKSLMYIEKGRIRVIASSEGNSALLLPIQFSHCLNGTSHLASNSVAKARLMRANLVETALIFDRQVDISVSFDFGPGQAHCRLVDAEDYKRMDFSPWGQ